MAIVLYTVAALVGIAGVYVLVSGQNILELGSLVQYMPGAVLLLWGLSLAAIGAVITLLQRIANGLASRPLAAGRVSAEGPVPVVKSIAGPKQAAGEPSRIRYMGITIEVEDTGEAFAYLNEAWQRFGSLEEAKATVSSAVGRNR
jgi:hypothetical protein